MEVAGVRRRHANASRRADTNSGACAGRDALHFLGLADRIHASKPRRAGYTSSGTTTNINVLRTMRNSFGRRLALKRPKAEAARAIEAEIAALDARDDLSAAEARKLAVLRGELEQMERRWRVVPYIDPTDVRHNRFEPQPQPNMQAVMFCLMDVSGSMGEREKDLAKRFFILLHLFLRRRYERIDVVFIRHTHQAQEVEEDVFFYSRETGGTVVSTALVELLIAAAADWARELGCSELASEAPACRSLARLHPRTATRPRPESCRPGSPRPPSRVPPRRPRATTPGASHATKRRRWVHGIAFSCAPPTRIQPRPKGPSFGSSAPGHQSAATVSPPVHSTTSSRKSGRLTCAGVSATSVPTKRKPTMWSCRSRPSARLTCGS